MFKNNKKNNKATTKRSGSKAVAKVRKQPSVQFHPKMQLFLKNSGFGGGIARSTEVKRFTFSAATVATKVLTILPSGKPAKDLVYSIPVSMTVYVTSSSMSSCRIFANLGAEANDNIISRSDIRVIGQQPQKLKLTLSKTTIAAHIDLEDANAKLPMFVFETTGNVTVVGKCVFEHATGLDFPALRIGDETPEVINL